MPHKVRFIQKPDAANADYERLVSNLISDDGYESERTYFGCATRERADEIRRGIVRAGRKLGVSVKAFWQECSGCAAGGDDCAYHVRFTAFHPDKAREYKAKQAKMARSA